MQRSMPFARLRATMALIAAAMQAHPLPGVAQQMALQQAASTYESHGKGGKRPHRSVGTKAFQRAAAKRRNKARSH